ncbi:RNA polymerase sigma factor [Streptomyces sp. NPDC004561]
MTNLVASAYATAAVLRDERASVLTAGVSDPIVECLLAAAEPGGSGWVDQLVREVIDVRQKLERRWTALENSRGLWLDAKQVLKLWNEYEHAKEHYEQLRRTVAERVSTVRPTGVQFRVEEPDESDDIKRPVETQGGPCCEAGRTAGPWVSPDEGTAPPRATGRPDGTRPLRSPSPRDHTDASASLREDSRAPVTRQNVTEADECVADAELVSRLADQGFTGVEYERFLDRLARYGLSVIAPWVRTGYVFARCADMGVRGLPLPVPATWSKEDIEEVVQDTVARAVVIFERDALRAGRWRSDGGASLATYFVGTCLFAFAEVYRRRFTSWRRQRAVEIAVARESGREDLPDVADAVVERETVVAFLAATTPDPRLRLVAYLHYEGHTHAEIAATLADGTTARAVEAMLYRYRKQLAQEGRERRDDR